MARTVCEGLTVVEMGSGSAPASQIGMLLADNGARVLKVEPPGGDTLRADLPAAAIVWNRGKESVVVDLRTDAGRQQVRSFATRADVVVEGFGAGVAEGWGLSYDDLARDNPALVFCSAKGFGSTGRYANLKAYEGVVAAKTGAFARGDFGFRSGPIFTGALCASNGAAHMGFGSLLAALIVRERTGRGQRVEATMAQGLTALDYFGVLARQYAAKAALTPSVSGGAGMTVVSRYGVMPCTKDGRWLVFSPQLPHQAHALLRATALTHTLKDPRFARASVFDTAEDAQEWEDMIWEAIRQKSLAEWLPILLAEPDLPFEVALSSEEALDHPQIRQGGGAITINDPELGLVTELGPVGVFSATPSVIERSAPAVGVHNGEPTGPTTTSDRTEAGQYPLAGKTIVEFGYFYAMPFAVTLAAALGARVIKLEGLEGDPMRHAFGPELGTGKVTEGKESVAVDLKTEEGRAIALDLLDRADAFVLGFRPGVAERLGIDFETVSARNPHLVYVHASAYGTDGPYAARPLYAQTAQAMAGNHHRQAGDWMDSARTEGFSVAALQAVVFPRLRGIIDGDSNAALATFSALMLGMFHQDRTGEGQLIATSMINGNVYGYSDDAVTYHGKPPAARADDEQYGLGALYRLYPTAQGWVFLAAPRQSEWEVLVNTVSRPELRIDERFSNPSNRRVHDAELVVALQEALAQRPASEWEQLLTSRGIGCVEVFEGGPSTFTLTNEGMREAGWVVESDHPLYGRVLQAAGPAQFSSSETRVAPACLLGDSTEAILAELGYSPDRISDLEAKQVVLLGKTKAALKV
jgi:crotonobetainyl-CoA:carnitine CoA-transferase CaiB-like acyl-CoA transferase